MGTTAIVEWPTAPLTNSLVLKALCGLRSTIHTISSIPSDLTGKFLQWSSYDSIEHSLTLENKSVLSSSYVFRKALIRKHFLVRTIHSFITKNPSSPLATAIPRTWEIEITFADELDEMWTDDLYDLAQLLDASDNFWFILKPGMADRGMGIRLFHSKDSLQRIFEEFEEGASDEEKEKEEEEDPTAVVISQLRHFVIQEYLMTPMLLDPDEGNLSASRNPQGHKFHLRAYVLASGALTVYLYTRVLALFSSVPYLDPSSEVLDDLTPHLTNSSLQADHGEPVVRLLDDLKGCRILSTEDDTLASLTDENIQDMLNQMSEVLSETFKAALENPVHFQPLPNAFELFGVDFLITHRSSSKLQVHLLELNAEPAIELTGPRLTWILEDLFNSIAKVVVEPFVEGTNAESWNVGEIKNYLRKCVEVEVRSNKSW